MDRNTERERDGKYELWTHYRYGDKTVHTHEWNSSGGPLHIFFLSITQWKCTNSPISIIVLYQFFWQKYSKKHISTVQLALQNWTVVHVQYTIKRTENTTDISWKEMKYIFVVRGRRKKYAVANNRVLSSTLLLSKSLPVGLYQWLTFLITCTKQLQILRLLMMGPIIIIIWETRNDVN